jgi:hypothetical protein
MVGTGSACPRGDGGGAGKSSPAGCAAAHGGAGCGAGSGRAHGGAGRPPSTGGAAAVRGRAGCEVGPEWAHGGVGRPSAAGRAAVRDAKAGCRAGRPVESGVESWAAWWAAAGRGAPPRAARLAVALMVASPLRSGAPSTGRRHSGWRRRAPNGKGSWELWTSRSDGDNSLHETPLRPFLSVLCGSVKTRGPPLARGRGTLGKSAVAAPDAGRPPPGGIGEGRRRFSSGGSS